MSELAGDVYYLIYAGTQALLVVLVVPFLVGGIIRFYVQRRRRVMSK